MWGYGYNMMGWGWLIGAVVVALLVIVAVIVVFRLIPGRANPSGSATARQILDERYAHGDITTDDYLERVKHLGGA